MPFQTLEVVNSVQSLADESIIAITPTVLSRDQIGVLGKGLNFSPSANFNLFQTLCDINCFVIYLL